MKAHPSNFIFAVNENPDENAIMADAYICITPAEVFYGEGCWCDQFEWEDFLEGIVYPIMESGFEPVEGLTYAEAREKLLALGLKEEPGLLKTY